MRVLTVCQHNAGRSQMAAAFLRQFRPDWDVRSAGVGPDLRGTTVPSSVVETLTEVDVPLDPSTPRQLLTQGHADWADVIVMIVEPELWPAWLPPDKVRYWPVSDPRQQPVEVLRAARDDIGEHAAELAQDETQPL